VEGHEHSLELSIMVAWEVMQVTHSELLVQVAHDEWHCWQRRVLFSKYLALQGHAEPVRTLLAAASQVVHVVLAVTQVLHLKLQLEHSYRVLDVA
jgi:hypothetical protein